MVWNKVSSLPRRLALLMAVATLCVACGGGSSAPVDTVPVISSQPQSQSVAVGTAVTFAVSAGGSSHLAYQWLRDNVPVAGATAASYQLPAVQLSDTKSSWSVKVTDSAGSVTSAAATLTVSGIAVYAGSADEAGSADGSLSTARFFAPAGLALDAAGTLYVADAQNRTIRKITAAGQVSTLAGTAGVYGNADGSAGAASFSYMNALAIDAGNNLYATDAAADGLVRKISPAGVVTTLPVRIPVRGSRSAALYVPGGLAFDTQGNLYVTNGIGTRKIAPDGTVAVFEGIGDDSESGDYTVLFSPRGVVADASNNVYIGAPAVMSGLPAGIYRFTTAGGGTAVPGTATLNGYALARDTAGNLYVADRSAATLSKVTPAGVVTTVAGVGGKPGTVPGPLPGGLMNPGGLALDPGGAVYITSGNAVLKIQFP